MVVGNDRALLIQSARSVAVPVGHSEDATVIELLVMRHAKSAWNTGAATDFDRPLANRGETDRWRMARWLADHDLVPERVVSSSAVRARQTTEAVVEFCGIDVGAVTYDEHFYGVGFRGWLQELATHSTSRLLICGHNPGLDMLVETLTSTEPDYTPSGKLMTTAAIAHLNHAGTWAAATGAAGTWTLHTVARPREV